MEEVGKILPAVFRKQCHRSEVSLLELLMALWPRVVGKGIARQARPVSFAARTLTIATSCPTWAVQFRQMSEEIRASVNRFLGGELVEKLRVRVDPTVDYADLTAGEEKNLPSDPPSSDRLSNTSPLEPDVANVLQQSYSKYFSRSQRKVH